MNDEQITAEIAKHRKSAGKNKKANNSGDAKIDAEIIRLAALSPVQYEQQRKDVAEKLGLRASILDKLVKAERPDDGNTQGSAIEFPEPEMWPEPVNGAQLLDRIADAVRNHVVMAERGGQHRGTLGCPRLFT
jgi:putative DNA primase/helicase